GREQQRPGGSWSTEQARCVLRQQPGVPSQARRGVARHEGRGLVRLTVAAQERVGVGAELPRGWCCRRRGELREGEGVLVWAGDHVPRAAAWGLRVVMQRELCAVSGGERDGPVIGYVWSQQGSVAPRLAAFCARRGVGW